VVLVRLIDYQFIGEVVEISQLIIINPRKDGMFYFLFSFVIVLLKMQTILHIYLCIYFFIIYVLLFAIYEFMNF
jgi:hypothetical protein